jgi:acetyl esterase/lipase
LKRFYLFSLAMLIVAECDCQTDLSALTQARKGFVTTLIRQQNVGMAVAEPPTNLFRLVNYPAPPGKMPAYVSVSPRNGKRHPAIIWIVGGFANSISEIAWKPRPRENDQSASAFWKAGVITMYPSLRGGNQNPGYVEGFYGEVDDVLAAADFLAKQDYVDPKRIYLGGHSTGGTLALLVAESSDRFRAVFAFGPVGNVAGYGQKNLPFNISVTGEVNLRSPAKWLDSIRNPTFVFEGTDSNRSNIGELILMSRLTRNPMIHFHPVTGANHFTTLAPMTALIAQKILQDEGGGSSGITFSDAEIAGAFGE